MLRQELIEKLETVAPALSSVELIPILSHFWFRNNALLCYNEQIAISTKLTSSFEGAVPKTLVSLLTASRAKDIEFIPAENELQVKAASSKFKLPFMDITATKIFEVPKIDSKAALPVDMNEFIKAIESCMRSLKEDTSMPDSLGITLAIDSAVSCIDMYATNDATISYSKVLLKSDWPEMRVVLSGDFCRQMLALSKLDGKKHLEINNDYSLFQSGDIVLFGKLVDVPKPLDFDAVIQSSFPESKRKQLVAIPSKLELILDRAIIITESKAERPKTSISVKDGIAKFFSQSADKGEVRDSVQLEEQHPEVNVSIDPRLFRNGFGAYDKFLLTENCLVMVKGNSLYLVSASQ